MSPHTGCSQILTAAVKIYLKNPSCQAMVFEVLKAGTEGTHHPDLRDKAFIYWRMLTTDTKLANKVLNSARPPINVKAFGLSPDLHPVSATPNFYRTP